MPYQLARPIGRSTSKNVRYRLVTTTPFTITLSMLKAGINIFGFNVGSPVLVNLPAWMPDDRIIVINDESGNASTYPITTQVV